jgi:hypothetical protein
VYNQFYLKDLLSRIHKITSVHHNGHFICEGGYHRHNYVNYGELIDFSNQKLLKELTTVLINLARIKFCHQYPKPMAVIAISTFGTKMVETISTRPRTDNHPVILPKGSKFALVKDMSGALLIDICKNHLIIVIDDVLNPDTTFNTVEGVLGMKPDGIAVIGDRSGKTASDLGIKQVISLETFAVTQYRPKECPLCKENVPIVRRPGYGWREERENSSYAGGYRDL